MAAQDDNARRPGDFGWTAMHSWIFLAIIAVGLLIVVVQNRYYYISPLGIGKAYRIDKMFGGIQEFDPDKGWVKALIQNPPAPSPMSMMQPPMQPGGPSLPSQMPGMMQPPLVSESPTTPSKPPTAAREEPGLQPPVTQLPKEASKPKEQTKKETREPSPAEKLEMFKKVFPDYGKEEFALANDDLYPDWKKKAAPAGTWSEFLQVYGDFVQWWNDQGQPPEPGMKLWRDFLASRPKR
ncbi:MAG: hypothetical protein HY914_08665 [Desulfomonile tiedjei]|nr:hypothetical protein [Desulfomonile tiedjei]